MCLAFVPGAWHRVPKTLGISKVTGVHFLIHNELLLAIPEFVLRRQATQGGEPR